MEQGRAQQIEKEVAFGTRAAIMWRTPWTRACGPRRMPITLQLVAAPWPGSVYSSPSPARDQ